MKKLFIAFLLFLAFVVLDIYFIEPNIVIEKNKTLYLPNWNNSLDGLKVAVVSDFHIGVGNAKLEKIEKIIKKINRKNPDIIFLLGDYDAIYINKNYTPKEVANTFKKFKSKYGTVSILGNHDYKPEGIIKECFKNTGIILLENENLYLKPKNKLLKVTGLKDLWHFPNTEPKNVIGKIDSPVIVLSHNPDLFPKIPNKVSLTLSGHTHGGEIILPFAGSPFVPSLYGQKYNKGHVIEGGKHLFVTSGITTTSGFRFLNPPEVLFLTLKSELKPQKDTKPKKGFNKSYKTFYIKFQKKLQARQGKYLQSK